MNHFTILSGLRNDPLRTSRFQCAGIILYVIKCCVPNNRKDNTNNKEDQACHKNITVVMLFGLTEFTRAVIGISLVSRSTHRDKGKHDISENEANADEGALAADIHHAREKRHQDAGDEESIR